jgi:hydroxymethylpyrimidine pyrophosphatase-like HAD family hydrolase
MEQIQAIALDLDGTLLNSDKQVSNRNLNILLKCHAQGIHIIIATARPPRAVHQFLPQELIEISSLIFYNGAMIHSPKLLLKEHLSISTELAREVYEFISLYDDQCYVYFEAEDQPYSDRVFNGSHLKVFGVPEHFPIPPVLDNMDNTRLTKILLPNHNIYTMLKNNFGEKSFVRITISSFKS